MKDRIRIVVGKLAFSQTNEPIMGRRIPNTEERFLGFLLYKRRLPLLKDFKPCGGYYEMWEAVEGNRSWFFDTKIEAENFAMDRVS